MIHSILHFSNSLLQHNTNQHETEASFHYYIVVSANIQYDSSVWLGGEKGVILMILEARDIFRALKTSYTLAIHMRRCEHELRGNSKYLWFSLTEVGDNTIK